MNVISRSAQYEGSSMPLCSLRRLMCGSAVIAAVAWGGHGANAQTTGAGTGDQLEEIVVTAQKRSENLQKVPISVSAFTSAALKSAGIDSATQLEKVTPGLTTPIAGGLVQPFIRGVGNSVISHGNESSVAMYVDSIYQARLPFAFFELSDVERIEVLKGPQGTLFGRNASGGLIQIITKDPTDTLSGSASIGYGNYDTVRADAFIGGPIAHGIKASLSAFYMNQSDGWGENFYTGAERFKQKAFSVRGKLLIDLGERTDFKLVGHYISARNDIGPAPPYEGTTIGNPVTRLPLPPIGFYDTYGNLPDVRRDKGWGVSGHLTHDLDFANFVSLTSYSHDYGGVPDLEGDYTFVDWQHADLEYDAKTLTQEFQLQSKKNDTLDWIMGVYYLYARAGYEPALLTGPGYGPGVTSISITGVQRMNSYAAFGQGTYHIAPTTNLTIGLRYSIDKAAVSGGTDIQLTNLFISGAPINADKVFRKLTYKAVLDQELAQDILAYASLSRGYKSGTYNTIPPSNVVAKPEVLDAYEIGLKSQFLDRRVRLNLAAFYYNFKNPQVQIINGPAINTQNAGKARVKGVEGELEAVVATGLNARLGAAYTDGYYLDYVNAVTLFPNPINGGNGPSSVIAQAAGNQLPRTPKFTFNAGFTYNIKTDSGDFGLDANYYYNSGFYWQPDNVIRQRRYSVINAGISYALPDSPFKIRAWAKNLTDKKYYSSANAIAGPAGNPATPAAPRTYGVTASANF